MHNTLKIFIFTAFFAPLITHGMSQENKIELGKQLVRAAEKDYWKIVKNLIHQKADLNQKNDKGWTALIYAVCDNRPEIVQMLIDAHASLNQKGLHGYTALICAALEDRQEVAHLLINAHADLNQKDNYGQTAMTYAAYLNRPKICHMIVRAYLDQITKRKKCVYTTLNCLKCVPGGQYSNLRNIFKPMLQAMIQEIRQPMFDDINRIQNDAIKQELLALCDRHQRQDRNSRCTIL